MVLKRITCQILPNSAKFCYLVYCLILSGTISYYQLAYYWLVYYQRLGGSRYLFVYISPLLRDSPILTSLRVLTFLTRAYTRPETPMHVPLQPLFILRTRHTEDSSSLSRCLCINTYSYAYVAFFNYYPVQYIVFQLVPTP